MRKKVIIVGGGTAGWMTACLMAKRLADIVDITVIESPDVPTVGVGEGSTPSLRHFFAELGITDADWMPRCQATYKVGIEFTGWSPQSGPDSYRHPFISQLDTFSERPFQINCQTRRLGLDVCTQPEAFLFNGYLGKAGKAPLTPTHFPFRIEYGYHFDSALLGAFLSEHAAALGVSRLCDTVSEVAVSSKGHISHLKTGQQSRLEADLFVDCTGFQSLLLQQALGVEFESFTDALFNNRAVVIATEADPSAPVETRSTALKYGWAWRIPLQHRTGNGYVYSDAYTTAEQAEEELKAHLGLTGQPVSVRHLSMKVGQVRQHWASNCLAVGLSQGFIEPLEATALHLVQQTIMQFCDMWQKGNFTTAQQDNYNTLLRRQFLAVKDYIQAHYKLNTRQDTAYWRDNRNNRKQDISEVLARQQTTSHFTATSWPCLLAGYGIFPPPAPNQPGTGDMLSEHELPAFFDGCLLNFQRQKDLWAGPACHG